MVVWTSTFMLRKRGKNWNLTSGWRSNFYFNLLNKINFWLRNFRKKICFRLFLYKKSVGLLLPAEGCCRGSKLLRGDLRKQSVLWAVCLLTRWLNLLMQSADCCCLGIGQTVTPPPPASPHLQPEWLSHVIHTESQNFWLFFNSYFTHFIPSSSSFFSSFSFCSKPDFLSYCLSHPLLLFLPRPSSSSPSSSPFYSHFSAAGTVSND